MDSAITQEETDRALIECIKIFAQRGRAIRLARQKENADAQSVAIGTASEIDLPLGSRHNESSTAINSRDGANSENARSDKG